MSFSDIWIDTNLRLQQLTWLDWLDLLLVTAALFLLLSALERAHQATFMVRGLGAIGLVLLVGALLLPLPTFSLLVRIILVFLLVALPVVFQRQLRNLFEDVGRSVGLARRSRRQGTEELMQSLVRAVEHMSAEQIGALIVLEGEMNLDEVAETGVALDAKVSSELLNSIFYSKNPLHDGALLIRGERAVAASCVLPIARGAIGGRRQLGTRHRAAVGISERTDTLVIVVSEETGTISVVEEGLLEALADQDALRERLLHFALRQKPAARASLSLRSLFSGSGGPLEASFIRKAQRVVARLSGALLFAVIIWWFVLSTSGSLPELSVTDVPLQIEQPPAGMAVAGQVPATVNLLVRTVEEAQSDLDGEAFRAILALGELSAGVHQLPVVVEARVQEPVHIVEVQPATVEVNVAPLEQRTVPVTVVLSDEGLLPAAYELRTEPVANPGEVEVRGPQPLVEQVAAVRATISLSNTRGPVETMQPLVAVDSEGNEIEQLMLEPAEAQVILNVGRRADMREVAVAIVTGGQPDSDYWISGLTVQPATVVLSGPPQLLAAADSSVATLPVDVTGAAGTVMAEIPLDLPPEVTVQTRDGETVHVVQVTVRVSPHRGDLTVRRTVQLPPSLEEAGVTVTPQVVELLLTGPRAVLQEIEQRPDLVQVVLPTIEVASGESVEQVPEVVTPEGVRAQLVTRRVTISRP